MQHGLLYSVDPRMQKPHAKAPNEVSFKWLAVLFFPKLSQTLTALSLTYCIYIIFVIKHHQYVFKIHRSNITDNPAASRLANLNPFFVVLAQVQDSLFLSCISVPLPRREMHSEVHPGRGSHRAYLYQTEIM